MIPVDHLSKYLAMRLTLDLDAELPEAYRLLNFCIYVAPVPGQFVPLAGSQTLRQINDKFWKVRKVNNFLSLITKPNHTTCFYNNEGLLDEIISAARVDLQG